MFAVNPLSLSVPDPTFESWLRDTGYLDILDDRANAAQASPTPTAPSPSSSSTIPPQPPPPPPQTTTTATTSTTSFSFHLRVRRLVGSILSSLRTALSILTLNPFSKLTTDDLSGSTPSWTVGFIGAPASQPSYSWPAGPEQARMRVHENVKRYARNYAFLTLLILVCSLYQMPKSLLGLVASLALWEIFSFCCRRWELQEIHPALRNVFLCFIHTANGVVLYYCNLQTAVIIALSISYAVMIIHASSRKLSSSSQTVGVNRHRRFQQKRIRS